MFKNVKKVIITSIAAVSLLSTSAGVIAHADVTGDETVQTSQNSDNSTVGIKLNKKNSTSGFSSLAKEANKHLHARYVYGATGPTVFDCSGFTRYIYKHSLSISLPRTAQAQYNAGTRVSEANAKKGDLVFFGGSTSSINHVGIYLGNGRMIDAQNRGVIKENVHASWWHLVGFSRVNG